MKTEIRTDLLRKLADHLLNGELGHEKFDFGEYNGNYDGDTPTNSCGTNGCAIGECPIAFPNDWYFNKFGEPRIHGSLLDSEILIEQSSGVEFFKISKIQYKHLFLPFEQNTVLFGGRHLEIEATKEEVAVNILAFCDLAEKGEL